MDATHNGQPPALFDWHQHAPVLPLARGVAHVYRVALAGRLDAERPESLMEWGVLSEEEQVRALRLVRRRDGCRFVRCRGALRVILAELVGIAPEAAAFRFGPGGKPELSPEAVPPGGWATRFNVSHSGDLALIAVSRDHELGVDIERRRPISHADRIVESYFTPAEQAHFRELDENARAEAFIRGWTRKEAILKAKGVGLAGLATGYETMFGSEALAEQFHRAGPCPRVQEWTLWEAAPASEYVAALAVGDPAGAVPSAGLAVAGA